MTELDSAARAIVKEFRGSIRSLSDALRKEDLEAMKSLSFRLDFNEFYTPH